MPICVDIRLNTSFSSVLCQAIALTNADLLPFETKFESKYDEFDSRKCIWKWEPCCLLLNALTREVLQDFKGISWVILNDSMNPCIHVYNCSLHCVHRRSGWRCWEILRRIRQLVDNYQILPQWNFCPLRHFALCIYVNVVKVIVKYTLHIRDIELASLVLISCS